MSVLEIKSLYDPEVYKSFLARVKEVEESTQPSWGAMSAAQMFAHCAEIQEVCNGKELQNTPFSLKLLKSVIKKIVLNDKPYRKSSPTHPQYIKTGDYEFKTEKERFISALEKFIEDEKKNTPHPFFGELTAKERGWAMYKHHSYHLEQFGV